MLDAPGSGAGLAVAEGAEFYEARFDGDALLRIEAVDDEISGRITRLRIEIERRLRADEVDVLTGS